MEPTSLSPLHIISGLPEVPHTWTLADPDSVMAFPTLRALSTIGGKQRSLGVPEVLVLVVVRRSVR